MRTEPDYSSLFQTYSGAMEQLFNPPIETQPFIQPDVSMTDWQEAPPSLKLKSNEIKSYKQKEPFENTTFEEKPKSEIIGKLTPTQKKAQEIFDATFKATRNHKNSFAEVYKKVDDIVNEIKSERGNLTKKDEQKIRNEAWDFVVGEMGIRTEPLGKMKAPKEEYSPWKWDKEKTKNSIYNDEYLGYLAKKTDDYIKNFDNYLDRFLTMKGFKKPVGEKMEIKRTDKIEEVTPEPYTFYEFIKTNLDRTGDPLISSRSQWDNSKGFTYITTPAKSGKRTDEFNLKNDNEKKYKDVKGVSDFLLDAAVLEGWTYMHRHNFNLLKSAIDKDEYIPVFKTIRDWTGNEAMTLAQQEEMIQGRADGTLTKPLDEQNRVNMKLKRPSEMSKEELKALGVFKKYNSKVKNIRGNEKRQNIANEYANKIDKSDIKIVTPLRQHRFDDINFKSGEPVKGFKNAKTLMTFDGDQTLLPYTNPNKEVYGRFDGLSVSFIFNDEYGNSIVREYTGPINGVKVEGESIKKDYNLKDGELVVGYHDVGSFSAKPQAIDGTLSINQWDGFNDDFGTGAALITPDDE